MKVLQNEDKNESKIEKRNLISGVKSVSENLNLLLMTAKENENEDSNSYATDTMNSIIENAEQKLKKAFAYEWLKRPHNPFLAAQECTLNEMSVALEIATNWIYDIEVREYKRQLLEEHGEEHFLPSKATLLHGIYHRAETCEFNDDYVKLMRLGADMRGHIEKGAGVVVNNNSLTVNKVMQVPVLMNNGQTATIDAWESALMAQQEKLTEIY